MLFAVSYLICSPLGRRALPLNWSNDDDDDDDYDDNDIDVDDDDDNVIDDDDDDDDDNDIDVDDDDDDDDNDIDGDDDDDDDNDIDVDDDDDDDDNDIDDDDDDDDDDNHIDGDDDDDDRELKQPRRRRQQKPHKFAYLTMKNVMFARFARAFLIFWHFEDVLVLSTTWSDLFFRCVDDASKWLQMFNFVHLCPKRWFQFNSRIVRTHFSSIMTLNNWKMIAETRSDIFRWGSRFRRRRVCLSSLITLVAFLLVVAVFKAEACMYKRHSRGVLDNAWRRERDFRGIEWSLRA